MKTPTILKGVITILLVSSSIFVSGQTVEQLQEDIKKAEREIKINTALLNSAKKDESVTLNQLKITRSSINNRKSIIKTLDRQADVINRDITSENRKISDLNKEVTTLKSDYSKMIVTAYKNYKLNNYLLFLFASKDFNDATKRIAYMKRYNDMREAKADQIEKIRLEIESKIKGLNKKHITLSNTTDSRKKELATLNKDESKFKANVKIHQNKQSGINRKLIAKEREIQKANKKLEQIIAEDNRKNKNADKSDTEKRYDIELSGRFDQNIGKLPYPLREGVVIDKFGIHAHTTIKGLKVNNPGINIAGTKGAPIYCVFEGVVTQIVFIRGKNNCVLVRHGNYLTLYTNLTSVDVKTGQKVALNQKLGSLPSTSNSNDWVLHFEIWKEATKLNPESCLKR